MRIATSELYSSTLQTMENQQSQLIDVEQEVSTGKALQTPAEDPVGAAQAVQLSATSATYTQYGTNQSTALSSLQLEDSTLTSVTTTLQSVESELVQAGAGTLNDSDRTALASELSSYRSQLLTLANTTDGTGSYIFAGFASSSQPFTNASGGGVTYSGDQGVRSMQVSSSRTIAIADTGTEVFMSVSQVGSDPVPAGASTNTGTGTIGAVTVSNPSATTNSTPYGIVFSTATGSLTYTVNDDSTNPPTALSTGNTYTAGQPIQLGTGMSVAISGTPANGDSFTVTQPNQAGTDIFAAIDTAIAALQTPTDGNTTAGATQQNAIATAMTKVTNAINNVTMTQASVGGREQELEALQSVTTTNSLQTQSNLSNLTSADYTATITKYTQLQTDLTASQKAFSATQGLSLFQYLNFSS